MLWLVKGTVSVGVLALLFYLVPMAELWDAVRSIPLWLWSGVVLAFLGSHLVAAAKWWQLAARPGGVALGVALKAHFAGLVANLCLPGVAGGDVVRAGLALRNSEKKELVAVGSVADRAVDCIALLLLAIAGAYLSLQRTAMPMDLALLIGGLGLAAGAGVAAATWLSRRFRFGGLLGRITEAVGEFVRRPAQLLFCLLVSLGVQTCLVLLNVVLASAAGVVVPMAAWFCAWPLAKLISIAPISLAGLGVREASLAALMVPFGASSAKIVAVGLVWQTVLIAGGLIGALVVLRAGGSLWLRPSDPNATHAQPLRRTG